MVARILPRVSRFAVLLALLSAVCGLPSPRTTSGLVPTASASCAQSCFSESATAYFYCKAHPGEYYYGCNFVVYCGANASSANAIYRDECLL